MNSAALRKAKGQLAHGASLKKAASSAGVLPQKLDLELWRTLGEGKRP